MRWGFLGASRIARAALAPAVLECGHSIEAIAARDVQRARDFGDAVAARRAYGDYSALIEDAGIDAVYISLTNEAHIPWAIRALAAGKHVLCEKPLGLAATEISALLAVEASSGRRAMEAFCHLHHPQIARVRALLADGALGEIVATQAVFAIPLRDPSDFRWHATMGGGALLDLGTYCASLLRVLFGEPRSVSAIQSLRGDVDATFTAQLEFPGLAAQFTCSFVATQTQHLEIVGSAGTLLLDWPISTKGRETSLFLPGGAERFPATDPYVRMVRAFTTMTEGTPDAPFALPWSLANARVLDALRLAANSQAVVTL
jgi:predicted dehydrogenase